MLMNSTLLAYIGPETLLPVTSLLAAIGGALMIGWRFVWNFIKRLGNAFSHRQADKPRFE